MAISAADGDEICEAEAPLLDDVVPCSVDFNGRQSVRSKSGCWKSASFLIVVGVAERFAYYGISLNLVSYLTGNLGLPTATAAAILNAWYGTSSLLPILGAYVADAFSGRFRMISASCVLYIAALGFLTLSASLNPYSSSQCRQSSPTSRACSSSKLELVFFFVSFFSVAFAQAGYLPCLQAFAVDQFDEEDESENRAKGSFFNWWNCFSTAGILAPLLALAYIQENLSWELGFGIPAVTMCFSLAVFLAGIRTYRFLKTCDGGSNPFVQIYRVFARAAAKNRRVTRVTKEETCDDTISDRGAHIGFLDKALLEPDGLTTGDVEDAKSILKLAPIWCSCLGYTIIYAQPSTLFTKQAATLNRHITSAFQIPAASLQHCFIGGSIIISLTIYDRVLVPVARSITKRPSGISTLQRVGTGLALSLVSIVFAAAVERRRLEIARDHGLADEPQAVVPMSVWWLAPQYVLSGVADAFAMVGLQEFFYDQVPSELSSVGLALYISILGTGNLVSSFLVSTIQSVTAGNGREGWFSDNLNRAHLDYFYWLLAGLSVAGLAAFVCSTGSYIYRTRAVVS
ncbi:protein NRT1/ PTR FAMILY 5.12-like [Salvia divinorum]|uniref:Protein NRT1/ PTR FAMILY 5.12-like n=1 Tax=Salvia divinorum TaxID=28513 RepID=A0ABD1GIM9_SALDI